MNTKLLMVEDTEERINWLTEAIKRYDLPIDASTVETAKGAISLLSESPFDIMLLDHDLKAEHYAFVNNTSTEYDRETGYAVASFLAGNREVQPDLKIIIHSMNPPGSLRMARVLQSAGRKVKVFPFELLRKVGWGSLISLLTKS